MSPTRRGRPTGADEGRARRHLLDAATATLREDGFVGASARTIAQRAGVNSASVFYHFGSVHDLLLAALDQSSERRLEAYRAAVAEAGDIAAVVRSVATLQRQDHADGHIAVMAALVGGAAAIPGLGPAIAERVQPWVTLVAEVIERLLADNPLRQLVDPDVLARAITSAFLGIELMSQLEGDRPGGLSLVDDLAALAPLAAPLLALFASAP